MPTWHLLLLSTMSPVAAIPVADPPELSHEQAHLPAEHPPSCQEARLPGPHAHACRSQHLGRSSRQGPHRTLGVACTVLARPNRITRGADYKAVVRRGARCAATHTVTYVSTSDPTRPARFGFIVSKQVGSAVIRNTIRRRLKAVCSEQLTRVRGGSDIVIRALPSAATADFDSLRDEVQRCIARRAS